MECVLGGGSRLDEVRSGCTTCSSREQPFIKHSYLWRRRVGKEDRENGCFPGGGFIRVLEVQLSNLLIFHMRANYCLIPCL